MLSFLKSIFIAIGALLLAALVGAAAFRVDRPLRMAVSVVAHDLCSKAFISGTDPRQAFADSLAPREGLS